MLVGVALVIDLRMVHANAISCHEMSNISLEMGVAFIQLLL